MKVDAGQMAGLLGVWSEGEGPLYRQLADRLRSLAGTGDLRDGTVLPAERAMARALSVSRGTVVGAYDALENDGVVERRQGSGTRIRAAEVPGPVQEHRATPLFDESAGTALVKAVPHSLVDVRAEFAALASRTEGFHQELSPEGSWSLRELVAAHLTNHGVSTTPEQILVTNGTQHACALVLRALCGPGDVVLTEELTWPGLTDAVSAGGARSYGVAMDDNGVDPDEMRRAVERLRPAAMVVNPHHHNPTGTRLPRGRRGELAAIAADYGVPLIEDRAFASLAFDGVIEPPLASLLPHAPIITLDSVSKVMWEGLRFGWVRGSTDLIGRIRLIRAIDDLGSAMPTQWLAEQLLPRFDQFLEIRCQDLRAKCDLAHATVTELLADWTVNRPMGGGSLWATLPIAAARAFKLHAARRGILVVTDETFAVGDAPDCSLRLSFTAPEPVVQSAIERLAEAWRSFDAAAGARDAPMVRPLTVGPGRVAIDPDGLVV